VYSRNVLITSLITTSSSVASVALLIRKLAKKLKLCLCCVCVVTCCELTTYVITTLSQHNHSKFTANSQQIHSKFTAGSQQVHSKFTAGSQQVHSIERGRYDDFSKDISQRKKYIFLICTVPGLIFSSWFLMLANA